MSRRLYEIYKEALIAEIVAWDEWLWPRLYADDVCEPEWDVFI